MQLPAPSLAAKADGSLTPRKPGGSWAPHPSPVSLCILRSQPLPQLCPFQARRWQGLWAPFQAPTNVVHDKSLPFSKDEPSRVRVELDGQVWRGGVEFLRPTAAQVVSQDVGADVVSIIDSEDIAVAQVQTVPGDGEWAGREREGHRERSPSGSSGLGSNLLPTVAKKLPPGCPQSRTSSICL